MANYSLKDQYRIGNIEVVSSKNADEKIPGVSFFYDEIDQRTREKRAKELLPIVGETITNQDFPSSMDPHINSIILGSFSDEEKKEISKAALIHEVTPALDYWHETNDRLMPFLSPERAHWYSTTPKTKETAGGHLTDLAVLLSRRNRGGGDLRGDKDAIEAFAALLMAPEISLRPEERVEIASHFFAHARMEKRAERQFDAVSAKLPESAARSANIIKQLHLEPEIMSDLKYCRGLSGDTFQKSMGYRQDDILDTAGFAIRAPKAKRPTSSTQEASRLRDRISATRVLLERSRKSDNQSSDMAKVNDELFKIGNDSKCGGFALIAPEISRQERTAELVSEKRKTKKDVELEA
jgi:hypothetical protein